MADALKLAPVAPTIRATDGKSLLLDLGCGDNKQVGYLGIDAFKTPAVDFIGDLFRFPWPIDDSSVDGVYSSHFFEHVPAKLRPGFMDELHRVLKVGAQATIITPYWSSMRAVQDFSHEWPPICESTYLYFNKGWRSVNKLTHGLYEMKCDFDFTYGYALDGDLLVRNQEWNAFALKHYIQAANDLHVTLTKRAL